MNKYDIVWGGRMVNSNNMLDGMGTIEGNTFEEARNEFYKNQLENGMRIGFCKQGGITFYDLNASN